VRWDVRLGKGDPNESVAARSRWIIDGNALIECREALAFPGEPGRAVLLRRGLSPSVGTAG
jgi:hypothetical protein